MPFVYQYALLLVRAGITQSQRTSSYIARPSETITATAMPRFARLLVCDANASGAHKLPSYHPFADEPIVLRVILMQLRKVFEINGPHRTGAIQSRQTAIALFEAVLKRIDGLDNFIQNFLFLQRRLSNSLSLEFA